VNFNLSYRLEGKNLIHMASFKDAPNIMRNDDQAGEESCCMNALRYVFIGFSYVLSLVLFPFCLKTFDQYERGVAFRLGKLLPETRGPGLCFFLPFVDSWQKVDLRIKTIDVPPQEMMTKDSVTCCINAIVLFHISNAKHSVVHVKDAITATSLLAQTTLRAIIGECELDEVLQKRELINQRICKILDQATDAWGVKVDCVEVKDVQLPANMQRAMAAQAEAERERRAKVIAARGEEQSSQKLLQAAKLMGQNPATMQLRYMQTLSTIASERKSKVYFPLPISMGSLSSMANMFPTPNPMMQQQTIPSPSVDHEPLRQKQA